MISPMTVLAILLAFIFFTPLIALYLIEKQAKKNVTEIRDRLKDSLEALKRSSRLSELRGDTLPYDKAIKSLEERIAYLNGQLGDE